MQSTELDLTADVIDVRDVIARIEELEPQVDAVGEGEHIAEWNMLTRLLYELKGYGGDEQWRGDWYPITLIADCYFTDYAQELAEDCGMINDNASWPNNCIDWDKAARELRIDYTPVTIGGATYWTR